MSVDKRVSQEEFILDTGNFNAVINTTKNLAKKMGTLKNELDGIKNNLMFSWAGEGRDTFEKKYRLLSQQFGDLKDNLMDISENLSYMYEQYVQYDTDLAKALDGTDRRY
ncbi:MAG: WXG100 family type VII secretion target [Ruminococcus sp.]|nr:WXG100 family type VII secretion target [Ruminococcus sp.]